MKSVLLELVSQIEQIKTHFHYSEGGVMPRRNVIYNVPEFSAWKQAVQFELQDISDRTKDKFIWDMLVIIRQGFNGWNDETSFNNLTGSLLIVAKNIDKYYSGESSSSVDVERIIKMPQHTISQDKMIFISHRSVDKNIADMLLDFLASLNVKKDLSFCSSLPGNDVKHRISQEIKNAIHKSAVNIVILSNEYYQSAYCLNEAGIIWFCDTPTIVIALPEIQPNSMIGFLDDEYKVRRLDDDNDIAAIYDKITDIFKINKSGSALTYEMNKLKERYNDHISKRNPEKSLSDSVETTFDDITTDDERIVLFYFLSHKVRKTKDTDIKQWVTENELYNVNIANAFDLLSSGGWGRLLTEGASSVFEFEISKFRAFQKAEIDILNSLKSTVDEHYRLSEDKIIAMWDGGLLNDSDLLFIAYIRDENNFTFGDRWMADGQIEHIKEWESKQSIEEVLSKDYGKCLSKFIDNNLVYESSWTSYGNPREYTLHKSIKEFVCASNFPYLSFIENIKTKYHYELPF